MLRGRFRERRQKGDCFTKKIIDAKIIHHICKLRYGDLSAVFKFTDSPAVILAGKCLIVLHMREPSIFRGIAVSLLRPVIGSNVEIN